MGEGNIALVTYGRISANAYKAVDSLKKEGVNIALVKLNKIFPLSNELIKALEGFDKIYFFEEGIKAGGIAEHLSAAMPQKDFYIKAIEGEFVPSAKVASALEKYNLDAASMVKIIKGEL